MTADTATAVATDRPSFMKDYSHIIDDDDAADHGVFIAKQGPKPSVSNSGVEFVDVPKETLFAALRKTCTPKKA